MSIKRPDLYEHNNPNLPIVAANNILGCKFVATINDLYTYSISKLTEGTLIWVNSENKYYLLIDSTNYNNVTGWKIFESGNNSILFYNAFIDLPLSGLINTIYIITTTQNIYYWNGSIYVSLSEHNNLSGIQLAGEFVTYGHINNNTQTIFGDKTFNNNVTVTGNLYVYGTEFITNTQTVEIEDNILLINKGELGNGITKGTGGIEIDRGNYTNYQFIFDESDDLFKVGEVGDLQVVATITSTPTNNYFGKWNSTNYWFDTVTISSSDLTDNSNLAKLNGIQTFTQFNTFSKQIISTLISGTAPFSVNSTTIVSNLNVDMVDGKHAQSSLIDITDALMRVGAFGLGSYIISKGSETNIDTTDIPTGFYYYNNSVNGTKPNDTYAFVIRNEYLSGIGWEIANTPFINDFWLRSSTVNAGIWNSWNKIHHSGNLNLSTVDFTSQNLNINGSLIQNLSPNHIIKNIIIDRTDYNSYNRAVILLHQTYDSFVFNMNYCVGQFIFQRGSSVSNFRHDIIKVNTASAYNNTSGNIESSLAFSVSTAPRLVTCYYNSVKYMALEIPYNAADYSYEISFTGYIKSTATEQLKLVSYYDTQNSGTILNSEINSSILQFAYTNNIIYDNLTSVFKNILINQSTGTEVFEATGNAKITGRFISTIVTGTSPLSILSTTKNDNLNADLLDNLHIGQVGTSYIPYADSSGNVGINIVPIDKLHVLGNIRSDNATYYSYLTPASLNFSRNNANYIWANTAVGYISIGTNGLAQISTNANLTLYTDKSVFNNYNVGIGTTTTDEKLTVSGNVKATRIFSIEPTLSPFTVVSAVIVTNLNADLVDGKHVQTSLTDTSDSLMRVGAFGLGALTINSDWNTTINRFTSSTTNAPEAFEYYGINIRYTTDGVDIAGKNNKLYFRTLNSNVYQSWNQIYHTGNLNKALIESLLTGNISSHTHDIYGVLAGVNTWTTHNYFNGGNVGVGTVAPSQLVEFVKSSTGIVQQNRVNSITTNDENTIRFVISTISTTTSGGELTFIRTNETNGSAAFSLKVSDGTTFIERIRVNRLGYVGFGTSTPENYFTINSTAPIIRLTNSDNNIYHQIDGDTSIGQIAIKADVSGIGSDSKIVFNIGDSNKVVIKSSGKVGFGTDLPDETIHVIGNVKANSFIGNASSATILETARTINGISFNGSANITIAAHTTNTLTIGTGLDGISFNGSSAITIALTTITAGDATVGAIRYNSTTNINGQFYGGTTSPTGTARLNYSGYFYPTYLNLTASTDTATAATHYYVETASDGYVRPKTLANVKTEIVTKAAVEAVLTGNLTSHTHDYLPLAGGSLTGDLTVGGNLIVNGTTVTTNSTIVTIDDPIFTLGGDIAPTVDDNKDRGIEFRWHNGTIAKIGFFGFDDSTGKFTFIPDGTNTAEVFSGTKGTIDANIEWADILTKPDPVVTVTLTGDVTGTANATLTDLGNGTISVFTTIAANSVALGTDTTGNYMINVSAGTGINISHTQSEGSTATITNSDLGSSQNIFKNFTDGTTTSVAEINNDTFKFRGSNGVTVTIANDDVTHGDNLLISLSAIPNSSLANSSITVGTTVISLGASSTTLAGLTSVTSTTFVGALTGNASTATILQTARTLTIGSTGKTFNGSSNVSWSLAEIGATTVGSNLFTLTNPSAITFIRINADNTISTLDAATFRTAIGAGTSSTIGTVTSVSGTGTVSGLTLTGTITSSGSLTLGGTLAVTASNFSSQTANTFLSAPNGSTGIPTFRTIVAADVPILNQNTTGSAATLTTSRTIAISTGVTGTATSFNGSSNITIPVTSLDASYLLSGTVPNARMSGIYTEFTHKIDGSNTIFTTPSSGTQNINGRTVYGLAEYRSIDMTGAIIFYAPDTTSSIMHRLHIEGMIYLNGPTLKLVVQGYRTTGAWSNTSKINLGITDIQVRWAVDAAGKNCIILGDIDTIWSYPHISITHAMFSHSGILDSYCTGWTVGLVTDLTGYTQLTSAITDSSISTDISGNASTATIFQTARTLTIGSTGKTFNGSANVNWSLAEIGASAINQTMYIGTTAVAINRTSAALILTGITSIDGSSATLTTARTIGDVSFNGSTNIEPERIKYKDTRAVNFAPYTYDGLTIHLKTNTTDSLNDGGTYHGLLDIAHWSDSSGGKHHQLGFTDNNNIYLRQNVDNTTWDSWTKIWHDNNSNISTVDWNAQNIIANGYLKSSNILPYVWLEDTTAGELDAFLVANTSKFYINFDTASITGAKFILDGATGDTTITGAMQVGGSGTSYIRGVLDMNTASLAGSLALPATSGATQSLGLRMRMRASGLSNHTLDFGTNGASGGWIQSTSEIDHSLNFPLLLNPNGGNIGIGTTITEEKVSIDGNIAFGTNANSCKIIHNSTTNSIDFIII